MPAVGAPPNEPFVNRLIQNGSAEMIGKLVSGRYRVDAEVASGGAAMVYRGEHIHLRKRVAIKILHQGLEYEPSILARFEREAIAGAHISHPNVAAARDFGKLPSGAPFLVLEYVDGVCLRTLMDRGPIPAWRAMHIGRQLALSLQAIHAVGIIHRDIKPTNIMVVEAEGDLVKLIDFGFAKVEYDRLLLGEKLNIRTTQPQLTTGQQVFGTPAYMAPEVMQGIQDVDERSDLYALGAVLYEALAGRRPFEERDPVRVILLKSSSPAPAIGQFVSPEDVPPGLQAIVTRLLETKKDDRFESARELVAALEEQIAQLPASLRPPETATPRTDDSPAFSEAGLARDSLQPEGSPTRFSVPPTQQSTRSHRPKARPPILRLGLPALLALGAIAVLAVLLSGRLRKRSVEQKLPPPAGAEVSARTVVPAESYSAVAIDRTPVDCLEPCPGDSGCCAEVSPAASGSAGRPASGLREEFWRALAMKDWTAGAKVVGALAAQEPDAFGEPDVLSGAARIAAGLEVSGAPSAKKHYQALSDQMGSQGIDILYEIVRTRGVELGPGKHAMFYLQRPDVLARAAPALRIAMQLRLATCWQKRSLFDQVAKEGDERALNELRFLYGFKCEKKKPNPCCFRNDAKLAQTITDLRSRLHVQ